VCTDPNLGMVATNLGMVATTAPAPPRCPRTWASALARDPRARAFFDALDRANRYAILWRVQNAKKPETRARRIEEVPSAGTLRFSSSGAIPDVAPIGTAAPTASERAFGPQTDPRSQYGEERSV
jgi:hypothetical protein